MSEQAITDSERLKILVAAAKAVIEDYSAASTERYDEEKWAAFKGTFPLELTLAEIGMLT